MNDVVATAAFKDPSPRSVARMAGAFYLLTIVTGGIAEMGVSDRMVVPGDAAATAAHFLAHRGLIQLAFAVYLIEMASQIALSALLYDLLKPVNRNVALLATFFSLTGCVIKALSRLFFVAPLLVLGGAHGLGAFTTEQLQALALLLLKLNSQGAGMALVFFGLASPLKGWLMLRSTFFPKLLGISGIVGGLGWLSFLYPPFAFRILPVIFLLGFAAAAIHIGWLLVVGVNEPRWKAEASAAAGSLWR